MAGKQELELFKAALGNPNHLAAINEHVTSQLHFMNTLKDNRFTPWDILELIEFCNDSQVRSLLIIVLFSQEDFFNNLPKESILDRLARDEPPSPSRINSLIQQLDIRVLSEQHLKSILPEAAVSILFSIRHFHLLDEQIIRLLFNKYLRSDLLKYWLKHYALMPNAHFILSYIVKFLYNEVYDLLNNQLKNDNATSELYKRMIEHLDLFPNFTRLFIKLKLKETHLEYAMKLYLNGHFYEIYPQFISMLALQHPAPSRAIIQLLFKLQGNEYLTKLLKKTKSSVYRYIQEEASRGNTSMWFEQGEMHRMLLLQPLDLKDYEQEAIQLPSILSDLPHFPNSISLFEYYLGFYGGSSSHLESLLKKVMNLEECKNWLRERLIRWLNAPTPSATVKSAIHNVLLPAAHELPMEFLHQIFNYDGMNTLRYYGLQGGAHNFIKLLACCQKLLLAPLTNEQQLMVTRAQLEARVELSLLNYHGLIGSLLKRFKRCYHYGWTGFFSPKPSMFTFQNRVRPPQPLNDATITNPSLAELLKNRPEKLSTNYLNQILFKLEEESLKNPMPYEYELRKKIQELMQTLTQNQDIDTSLRGWYNTNQVSCTRNLIRLIEITFMEGSLDDVHALLADFHTGSNLVLRLQDELFSSPITLKPQPLEPSTEPEKNNELIGDLISAFNKVSSIATQTLSSVSNAIPWNFWQTSSAEQQSAPLPPPDNHYH